MLLIKLPQKPADEKVLLPVVFTCQFHSFIRSNPLQGSSGILPRLAVVRPQQTGKTFLH
jgi:hypothetical protein